MIQLNNKERKKLLEQLNDDYGIENLKLDYLFFKKKDNSIFLITKDFLNLDKTRFRVDSFGLYFGEIEKNGLRLSISGSQLIGSYATKNCLEINDKENWLNGQNLECDHNLRTWVIIKNGKDFLGCGYCKNGIVMNFIPKKKQIIV